MDHRTERLHLRQWRDSDREPFARMNRDPCVMRYFTRHFTIEESNAFITDHMHLLATRGWGNWAIDVIDCGAFAGFAGLSVPPSWHPCADRPEIGWRLKRPFWGVGHATEAARKIVDVAFDSIGLNEIISYTATCNAPSIAIMRKLGMVEEARFDHPRIAEGHALRSHVVYRLDNPRTQDG